jgi:hypothetical protein
VGNAGPRISQDLDIAEWHFMRIVEGHMPPLRSHRPKELKSRCGAWASQNRETGAINGVE